MRKKEQKSDQSDESEEESDKKDLNQQEKTKEEIEENEKKLEEILIKKDDKKEDRPKKELIDYQLERALDLLKTIIVYQDFAKAS